jgi:hypothetical protein
MVSVESKMVEMAQRFAPARGYRSGEIHAARQTPQRIAADRAGSVAAKPKKLSCKTCSGQRCIGLCRF